MTSTIRTREQAAQSAEAQTTNVVGRCQEWTRNRYLAPSAGDRDHDGDADAVDGWLSEPKSARHPGDRNPPRGVPVAFANRFGHRAVSLGGGRIRSTDMSDDGTHYQAGNVGTTTIGNLERSMGIKYLGWTDTISGFPIPNPAPPRPRVRGKNVEAALASLRRAEHASAHRPVRLRIIRAAIKSLTAVPTVPKK